MLIGGSGEVETKTALRILAISSLENDAQANMNEN